MNQSTPLRLCSTCKQPNGWALLDARKYAWYCGECYGQWETKFLLDLMVARQKILQERD
jgi:RNA polymerase-binding transcription factor DksA